MSWAAQGIHRQLMTCYEQIVSVSSHHMQQVSPTCACIDVLHIFSLHFVQVHIGHRACMHSQLMQCLVSWDTQQVSLHQAPKHACIGVMHI